MLFSEKSKEKSKKSAKQEKLSWQIRLQIVYGACEEIRNGIEELVKSTCGLEFGLNCLAMHK